MIYWLEKISKCICMIRGKGRGRARKGGRERRKERKTDVWERDFFLVNLVTHDFYRYEKLLW